jgi:hypothetical protein
MVISLMVVIAATALSSAPSVGELTMAADRLRIERDGRVLSGVVRSAVVRGDRLATELASGAGFFAYDGQVVYLAPATVLTVDQRPELTLALERGEIRVTSGRGRGVRVVRGGTLVSVSRGVVRAAVHAEGMRIWAERGEAEVSIEGGTPLRLVEGEETVAPVAGSLRTALSRGSEGWSIHVDELQLASAAHSSRRAKRQRVDEANEATVLAFQDRWSTFVGPPLLQRQPTPPLPRVTPTPPEEAAPVPPAERGGTAGPPSERTGVNETLAQPTTAGENQAFQPIAVDQPVTLVGGSGTFALALGAISGSASSGLSGGASSDAQQDSFNRSFPGNINLVSAQSKYELFNVHLRPSDKFPSAESYWSIGLGKPPTSQVATDFRTASSPFPRTLVIPHFDAYLVNLSQYGVPNLAMSDAAKNQTSALGFSGLVGATPAAPRISGATPLTDNRAVFNNRATFALGEFATMTTSNGKHEFPLFFVRRSDQDRQIIKSPTGNDNLDIVHPNPQVTFTKFVDNKFFPELPFVQIPASNNPFQPLPNYGSLDLIRRAAFTTLMADSLFNYSRRTGQTRFVVDNRIVDISGYHPRHRIDPLMLHASGASPAANLVAGATRSGSARHAGHH